MNLLILKSLSQKVGLGERLNKKLDKTGGVINGRLTLNSSWNILNINSEKQEGALIYFGENGGSKETAKIGFESENSDYFRISNEKTGTILHILDGYAQIDGKKCLTTDDADRIVPVGGTIIWNSSAPYPDNFLPNEGRSFSAVSYPALAKVFPGLKLPDDRGYAIRVADNGRGVDSGRTVGVLQEDAGRNLTGELKYVQTYPVSSGGATGVFSTRHQETLGGHSGGSDKGVSHIFTFDASRQWPTANEFRMKNVAKILITRVK